MKDSRIAEIKFTIAELSALLSIAATAEANGHKFKGPAQWAMDRIFKAWRELSQEPLSRTDPIA